MQLASLGSVTSVVLNGYSIWGVVNWFYCTECGEPFQCKSFKKCAYHPGTLEKTEMGASRGCFSCCKKSVSSFSPLLKVEVST